MANSRQENKVLVQRWMKRVVGLGDRNDGLSLHMSEKELYEYSKKHFDAIKSNPHVMTIPDGQPFWFSVSDTVFCDVLYSADHGVKYSEDVTN